MPAWHRDGRVVRTEFVETYGALNIYHLSCSWNNGKTTTSVDVKNKDELAPELHTRDATIFSASGRVGICGQASPSELELHSLTEKLRLQKTYRRQHQQ